MSWMACMTARTAATDQNAVRLRLGATAATANIPSPRSTCITHSQVRLRPNRSTRGLQRNLKVTARWNPDVDEIWDFEAPIAVRNSVESWWRKLQGRPSPKYVVEVQSRFFLDFGAPLATVQRWSRVAPAAASFFRG